TGGVNVAVGDVNGDGRLDIITAPDAGGGPEGEGFSGTNPATVLADFNAHGTFPGGVRVAAGGVEGDGRADIITGPGPGGGPNVRVFSTVGPAPILADFMAYNPTFTGGIYVAAGDVNGDGLADIITGPGLGGGPEVKAFSGANVSTVLQ